MEINEQSLQAPLFIRRNVMNRLLVVYTLSFLVGICVMRLEHVYIADFTFQDVLTFRFPAIILGSVLLLLMLLLFSYWRLDPVRTLLKNGQSEGDSYIALKRIFRLPYELLIVLLTLGFLLSIGVHFMDVWKAEPRDWPLLLGTVAGEQSAILSVAIFVFISVRWLFRPLILQLKPLAGDFSKRASIAQPLLVTYAGTFLAAILNLFELAILETDQNRTINPYKFASIAGFYFIMGFCLFFYVTLQFRHELRGLIRNIHSLVGTRKQLSGTMPVISHDEVGELAVALNELQGRVNRDYESFEKELKLAYNVQQKLLPPGDLTIGSYRITARCQPYREVGGDFFDVVSLSPSRFAVMIGDVSGKGMPAALLMSAQLLLFRSEIRRNGSPGEVLARMNRQLCEAMGEEGSVSIGVGVIDLSADTVLYASAGHLSPYIVTKNGSFTAVDCSSLPIGFDAEAQYEEKCLQLASGDRFVLYTDGLIEAEDDSGRMYSFEGLEAELATWEETVDMAQLVDDWLLRMDERCGPGNDDRTVVILELAGEYRSAMSKLDVAVSTSEQPHAAAFFQNQFMSREWTFRSKLGEERQVALQLGRWIEEKWPESTVRDDVQSAVAEAMINAIEHGNKLQPNSYVTVLAQIGSMLSVCKIYDEGGGYFPRVSRDEDEMLKKLESDDPRGWGLVMIDSLADYWATGRDDRGFYTELYFMRKTKSFEDE